MNSKPVADKEIVKPDIKPSDLLLRIELQEFKAEDELKNENSELYVVYFLKVYSKPQPEIRKFKIVWKKGMRTSGFVKSMIEESDFMIISGNWKDKSIPSYGIMYLAHQHHKKIKICGLFYLNQKDNLSDANLQYMRSDFFSFTVIRNEESNLANRKQTLLTLARQMLTNLIMEPDLDNGHEHINILSPLRMIPSFLYLSKVSTVQDALKKISLFYKSLDKKYKQGVGLVEYTRINGIKDYHLIKKAFEDYHSFDFFTKERHDVNDINLRLLVAEKPLMIDKSSRASIIMPISETISKERIEMTEPAKTESEFKKNLKITGFAAEKELLEKYFTPDQIYSLLKNGDEDIRFNNHYPLAHLSILKLQYQFLVTAIDLYQPEYIYGFKDRDCDLTFQVTRLKDIVALAENNQAELVSDKNFKGKYSIAVYAMVATDVGHMVMDDSKSGYKHKFDKYSTPANLDTNKSTSDLRRRLAWKE